MSLGDTVLELVYLASSTSCDFTERGEIRGRQKFTSKQIRYKYQPPPLYVT